MRDITKFSHLPFPKMSLASDVVCLINHVVPRHQNENVKYNGRVAGRFWQDFWYPLFYFAYIWRYVHRIARLVSAKYQLCKYTFGYYYSFLFARYDA